MSVTEPKGFVAAGIACGIKPSGAPDLSLVATDDSRPVAAAAVFTANLATAAPVQVSREHLEATGG
ncbi:MAG: glutamate N-acetyltransferase / amino-acid N-acetyltransferase [Actinomycetota bacterium]|nr:glutamate N-acetyltransferase / amino-acid N-acetyltransferase [Actinomycetota bacterium]